MTRAGMVVRRSQRGLCAAAVRMLKLAMIRTNQTNAPLFLAAARDNVDCVRLLIATGADPGKCDSQLRLPLHLAALNGCDECVAELIAAHP